jgi:predicted Na+-dependent transporter
MEIPPEITIKISLLVFLVSSMLATGMQLTPRDLLPPLCDIRLVLQVLALNFVVAPGFAWLLTLFIPLESGHAIGLLLVAGAAGAPFLPKLAEVSRGDSALAISIMALLTAGTLLYLPLVLPLLVPGLSISPWSIAKPLALTILAPMVIGMCIRGIAAPLSLRVAPVLASIGTLFLIILFVLLMVVNAKELLGVIGSGAIAVAVLYVAALFTISWVASASFAEKKGVVALATSARNFGAAFVPAANSISDPDATIMITVNAMAGLVVCFLAALWVRKRTSGAQQD